MATDAYLKIDGINGESEDERHRNWIEVQSVVYAVHQPRATVLSTAGGHTTGRANLYPITFQKLADLASPILLQTCAVGKTLSNAVFEFMRADGDGKPITYFKIELENLIIASITPDSGEGGIITERVQFAYAKIKWHYIRQSIKGGMQGNTQGGWDCSTHKVC
ncbi:Hcp family type VI secretion system effector [Pseudoduganella albidiflava]|uniref:Type VI secretion system tube protein Hcp n=1 Tax=Pseudoduganella albidiflava TaxID=321983 RepID=A0A411X1W0_9BURK|nr:type VI secretion system tube protein Hcp [Pseudoduganella albidiflava]QBI02855.1 type VI secretion system tube protein Hcp [Pseudoduganella albidiflava]GGY56863.1 hypothetical protein GCM10007387_44280 [Pseudoduganella albidiflava]